MSGIRLKYSIDGDVKFWRGKEFKRGWLNLRNLTDEDFNYIKSNFQCFERENELAFPTTKPSTLDYPDTANIIGALEYLQSTGRYIMPSVEDVLLKLKFAIKNIVSKEEMQDTKKSTDEMWIEFMNRIEEPEMKELINSIAPYYMGDSTYGWKLAFEQALRVKKYKPDATFVKTSGQWQRDYNRDVVDNATRIIILVPYDRQVRSNKDTMDSLGYDTNATRYKDLSRQQKDVVDISSRSGEGKKYQYIAVYDISDTVLRNGEEDVFNDTIGLKNNLTGELNQHAINDKMSKGFGSVEDINKIYHNEVGNIQTLTIALAQGIQKTYPDIRTLMPQNTTNESAYYSAFETMVLNLADRLIEDKAKIVRQENREKGMQATLVAVLALCRLNAKKVALNLQTQNFQPKYYYELREVINNIINLINKNMPRQENRLMIQEEIPYINSMEELFDILDVNEENFESEEVYESKNRQKSLIKENFYNVLKKLK